MSKMLSKFFAALLRRKIIKTPDGSRAVKWYHSETQLAGILIGLQGIYLIIKEISENYFNAPLPDIPDGVLLFVNTILGGTVLHGRNTANSKIIWGQTPEGSEVVKDQGQ